MRPRDRFTLRMVVTVTVLAAGQDAASQARRRLRDGRVRHPSQGGQAVGRGPWTLCAGIVSSSSRGVSRTAVLLDRTRECLAEVVDGVPVLGDVARQTGRRGCHDVAARRPALGHRRGHHARAARARGCGPVRTGGDGRLVASRRVALVVLPRPDDAYALAYRVALIHGRRYFVDAEDGGSCTAGDALLRQSAGGGAGARGAAGRS